MLGGRFTPDSSIEWKNGVKRSACWVFGLAFMGSKPRDYDEAKTQDAHRFTPFFHSMLESGVNLPPSIYEAWFVTAAHDEEALSRIASAFPAAAKAAAAA